MIASGGVWRPGVYQDERTAKFAFKFASSVLYRLQLEANTRDGAANKTITMNDLMQEKNKEAQFKNCSFSEFRPDVQARVELLIAAAVVKERERLAVWYSTTGWLLNEADVPGAMRTA